MRREALSFILFFNLFILGCGDNRAGFEDNGTVETNKGVLGVVEVTSTDKDGDGISDEDEINIYGTDPSSADTDGDCLLDGFEINNYETNATNKDTDGDGIDDGIEIYTDDLNNPNRSCIENPESLENGANDNPAMDNYPDEENDIINALDSRSALDSDGDGIPDEVEVTIGTNPLNADSDGDGLSDSEELKYGTDPLKEDSDNDGLKDGAEVKIYDTNATNPDTDGDCLLDGFEINNYETNATNKDTDGDGIEDGIEIYSDEKGVIDKSCLDSAETLENGPNPTPAKDNTPVEGDVIDALDPDNDSDGDGQVNSVENNCSEGDPLDVEKMCPYLMDNNDSKAISEQGYAYIPGGFDVDNDGKVEGGFWISRYQARKADGFIDSVDVISDVGSINQYVSNNFKVLNKNIQVTNYSEGTLDETTTFSGHNLTFNEAIALSLKRITGITPYLALVSLKRTKIINKDTNEILDFNITLPTMKQYLQVKMLLDADKANNGDGRHIRNGLLGVDPNVPLIDYTLVIDEFTEETKEYVRNLVQIRDTSVLEGLPVFSEMDIPDWWRVEKFIMLNTGANATQDLGFGIGSEKDAYAITVRARGTLDVTQGMSGALSDDEGTTNGISFRAATDYLW